MNTVDEAMRRAVMDNWDGRPARIKNAKTHRRIYAAALLLTRLHLLRDMPLSVIWLINPRNIELDTGLVGQVYHHDNDRDRTLADMRILATILDSDVFLGPAIYQSKAREYYEIRVTKDGVPVNIWAYVRREPDAAERAAG